MSKVDNISIYEFLMKEFYLAVKIPEISTYKETSIQAGHQRNYGNFLRDHSVGAHLALKRRPVLILLLKVLVGWNLVLH